MGCILRGCMSNISEEDTMKRNVIIIFLISVMVAGISGCILSTNPNPATPITLKVGVSQTFKVTGMLNGPYQWYMNDIVIPGATSTSYTYTAVAEDNGVNKIKIETKDQLNKKTLVKEWTVNVVNNLPPVANAGPDRVIHPFTGPEVVQLDGSLSSDPEDEPLTYLWEIVSKPGGSSAVLSDTGIVNPTFVADVEGSYTISLYVSDGEKVSDPSVVIITAYNDNAPPVSNAGDDQSVLFGNAVQLDGSASYDPEGVPVTYTWALLNKPNGSQAVLNDSTSVNPTFTPNKKGDYLFSLVVSDGVSSSNVDEVKITVYNNAPIANAGSNAIVDFGSTAQLDGSLSEDPDGTTLSYTWTVDSAPAGSIASITNPTLVNPTFTPDKRGVYILKLVVSDGDLSSEAAVQISTTKHAPVANAGTDAIMPFGETHTFTGALSFDPDEDVLTYAWTVIDRPADSVATLSDPTGIETTFRPDKQGTYTLRLIVFDGEFYSAPDYVTLATTNHRPVAEAGSDTFGYVNTTVHLNGSASSDADGDPLSYAWTILSNPAGSSATLSGAASVNPTLIPDKKGDYIIQLIVFDGQEYSLADTVKITVSNRTPTAEAGANIPNCHYNVTQQLNGNASMDLDGDPLTYAWSVTSRPSGSTAALSNANIINPTFKPDKPGTYVIQLIVNDGTVSSAADTVTLTTYQETIVENWDDGVLVPWSKDSDGSWGTINVDDEEPYSGNYSFWAQGAWAGGNWLMLSRTFTNTYLIQIDFQFRGYAANMSALKTSLYFNDSKYADVRGSSGNTWYLKSYTPNMAITKVGFYFDSFWGTDGVFIDDIVFTVWN